MPGRRLREGLDFRPLISLNQLLCRSNQRLFYFGISCDSRECLDFQPLLSSDFLIRTVYSGRNPKTKADATALTVPKFPSATFPLIFFFKFDLSSYSMNSMIKADAAAPPVPNFTPLLSTGSTTLKAMFILYSDLYSIRPDILVGITPPKSRFDRNIYVIGGISPLISVYMPLW